MQNLIVAFTMMLFATGVFAQNSSSSVQQQAARFSASCTTNLSNMAGYKDLQSRERSEICACVDREVNALFKGQPNIIATSFAPLYRSYVSSCSRPAFVRAFEQACRLNNAEIRTLIEKDTLEGAERDRFCSCVGAELWEWQRNYRTPPESTVFAAGGADAARACDAKQ